MKSSGIPGYRSAASGALAQRAYRRKGNGGEWSLQGQYGGNALPSQARNTTEAGAVRKRLDHLMLLSGTSGDRELAAWLELSFTTVQKLTTRGIRKPTALKIAKRLKKAGYDVSLAWLMDGQGDEPRRGSQRSILPEGTIPNPPHWENALTAAELARKIVQALERDLNRNEVGQWSSLEMQRTLCWALKDLARRLKALHFDMGETFVLTDEWAERIGLPARDKSPG